MGIFGVMAKEEVSVYKACIARALLSQ